MKATFPGADSRADCSMVRRLRARNFDAAVVFTVYTQSPLPAALMCYLAGIPLRLAHCRENPYQLLTDWVPEPEPERFLRHEVRRQLDLVRHAGCTTGDERMRLRITARSAEHMQAALRELGLTSEQRWTLMHPGATAPSRRYAPESFAAVARSLTLRGWRVIFTGVSGEQDLVEEIRAGCDGESHSFAGLLTLEETAALISLAPLLISNNTGPVHIAAATGTPVVDLYALTNPQHTPWSVPCRVLSHDVPCKYCYKSVCPEGHNNCLRLISPESVVNAAEELILKTAARRTAARDFI
jgi:lipopolysaccharide heptosyltransferase II